MPIRGEASALVRAGVPTSAKATVRSRRSSAKCEERRRRAPAPVREEKAVDPESSTPVLAADGVAERPIGHRLVCLRDLAVSPAARAGLSVRVLVARHAGSRTGRKRRHPSCPGVDVVGPTVGGRQGAGDDCTVSRAADPVLARRGRPRARVALRHWRSALALPDRRPGQRTRPAAAVAAVSIACHRLRRVPLVPMGRIAAGDRSPRGGAGALDADSPAAAGRAARDITLADLVVAVPSDVSPGRRQADERRSDVAGH